MAQYLRNALCFLRPSLDCGLDIALNVFESDRRCGSPELGAVAQAALARMRSSPRVQSRLLAAVSRICAVSLPLALGSAACTNAALLPDHPPSDDPQASSDGHTEPEKESDAGSGAGPSRDAMRAESSSSSSQPAARALDGASSLTPHSDGGPLLSAPDAGTGPSFPPLETDGEPLPGASGRWIYTEFPDAHCRDGSPAGVAVNLGSSDKLMIFLEAGGMCVDAQTCLINPANTLLWLLLLETNVAGVFDRDNPENPVRDWNFVYVPYCTGDRHAGANPDAEVPEVGPQEFVGYLNVKKFMNRIVPTFPDATDVLVTGVSAGGFGALMDGMLVQRAFPNVKVKALSDSGPPVSTAMVPQCMQDRWRTLFKYDQTFLADCGAACPDPHDYWLDYAVFLAQTFRDRPLGVIESAEDAVERSMFSVGNDDCTAPLDLLNPAIPGPALREDLVGFRKHVEPFPMFSTFYPETDQHGWIVFDEFYTVSAGGMRLVDWFTKFVNGESPGHAGP